MIVVQVFDFPNEQVSSSAYPDFFFRFVSQYNKISLMHSFGRNLAQILKFKVKL